MRRMMLLAAAAAGALTFAGVPAFAQSTPTDCPPGTVATNPDAGPVTCESDDNADDTTGSIEPAQPNQGDDVLDTTRAGEGVKDALTGDGGAGNDGGNNN